MTSKCGPDSCPITTFSDLTRAEQKEQRARKANEMRSRGFTQAQIAKQFGVAQSVISDDLKSFNLSVSDKLKKAKTSANPKGAGRPNGSRKRSERLPKAVEREDKVEALHDAGLSAAEIAEQTGLHMRSVHQALEHIDIKREARAEVEPIIRPQDLSMSQQLKNEIWRRQEQARLLAQFQQAVNDRVREIIDEIWLPDLKKQVDQAQEIFAQRRGVMTKDKFNAIRRALHPDSRRSISDEKLAEAFDAFMALEKYLLDEKDSPTHFAPMPNGLAEWDKTRAARKAKRHRTNNGHSAVRPA